MVREDILGGLRNALERGESLEQAKISMINAGYSQQEVDEAANFVSSEQEEEKFIPTPKEKPAEKLKPEEIKEVIDISKLKTDEIKEVSMPSPPKKGGFLKYLLIGGGIIFALILIGVIIYFLGESLDIKFIQDIISLIQK